MEPVVQYSPKDPLYDPKQDNLDDSVVNKNEIYAQSKILHIQDDSLEGYGPPYGTLPTAPLYSHEPHPHYYEAPEPIIEIIIKESNESLPAPPPPPVQKKKKEPVHVFYVKYSKDPHSKDKVIYEKPIPAITPPTNEEDDREHEHEHNSYVTVTPEPYIPRETTTLRAIIKPESEVYHSDSSVKISFGSEGRHYSDRREGHNTYNSEDHEETAPKPAIVHPNQPLEPTLPSYPQLERSASPKSPQTFDSNPRPIFSQLHPQPSYQPPHPQPSHQLPHPQPSHQPPHPQPSHIYRSAPIHAQSRIQFQPQPTPNEQQLPRQGPSVSPFRPQVQPLSPRIPFAPTASFNPPFSNGPVGPITQFGGPTPQAPSGSPFPTAFPRTNNGQTFNSRNNQQNFASRQQFNGPPKVSFHSGPQRPFAAQSKPYFDDPKYLQENYHTITADLIDQPKRPLLPNRPLQSFGPLSQPNPSASTGQFQDHRRPSPVLPQNQQLPQQRPPQQFIESGHSPTINPGPSSSPFFNLKPSPPHIESNRPPFQQHPLQPQPQQQFGFHQGPQILPRPTSSVPLQQQYSFSASPSPIPHNQFVPQPSSTPLFNFRPQPSPTPEVFRPQSPSERPQFHQHGPSERPQLQQHGPSERPFNQHLQNFGSLVPNGGELVASVPKYEQHITVNGPTAQPFSNLGESSPSQPSPTPSQQEQIYQHQFQQQQIHKQQQQQQQHQQHQQQQHQQHQQQQQQLQQQQQQQHQQQQHQQQHQQQQQQQQQEHQQQQQHQQQILHQQQQQYHDDHVRLQLAQNVQKQQEEIQRLQAQLLDTQQQQQVHQQQIQDNYQQQFQATSPRSQYIQERSRPQHPFPSSTSSPPYYQTSRTVEIKPTTQKYVSSTQNSVSSTAEPQKEEKPHKKPAFELPDEVPDDLRQQLLSSGILDNADISVLDYDKVGETPLESLPPDQLANFFGAGGGQQIASTENRPVYVQSNGDQIESRIDEDISEDSDDQDLAASENVPSYVAPPSKDQTVEMKVVHFDPATLEGQNLAKEYIQENATQVDPVALNDKRYNRYLPLKVSGNQFPLPDILKGRKVASVVVLAPVETEALTSHSRKERATTKEDLKGIRFIAGESLQELLKRPTKDNFIKWLDVEKKTETDLQSVVLLVTGDGDATDEKEIFMYDIASGKVNKISGDLSNAFVEAAENNSLSQDFESLAIEGEGVPESFDKETKDIVAAGSDNVPLFVDLSGLSLDQKNVNQVSISSSYSKTKLGRSFRRH